MLVTRPNIGMVGSLTPLQFLSKRKKRFFYLVGSSLIRSVGRSLITYAGRVHAANAVYVSGVRLRSPGSYVPVSHIEGAAVAFRAVW